MNTTNNTNNLNTKANDLNTQAVNAMWAEGNKEQSNDVVVKNCESILKNAFNQAEKEMGRPMTYAEMRERFG